MAFVHNVDNNVVFPIIPRNKWDFITQTIESSSRLEYLFAVSGEIQEYTVVNHTSSNQINKPTGADWNTNDIIVYKKGTIVGQEKIENLQGKNRLFYAGAYLGYGFHEDGVKSGMRVAQMINNLKE